jgi:hypothetical protein
MSQGRFINCIYKMTASAQTFPSENSNEQAPNCILRWISHIRNKLRMDYKTDAHD